MTYLCVPIFVRDRPQTQRDMALAAEAGADMVELRIDQLKDPAILGELLTLAGLPCIVTCRPTWEGGQCQGDDGERFILLAMAGDEGASYIDLELKSAQKHQDQFNQLMTGLEEQDRPRIILSAHDFSGRPPRLYNLIAEMNALPHQVNKIVWTARTVRDNLEAFEVLRSRHKPTIALCMGEAGVISRILARKFGAFLTFAALDQGAGTAAGQITIADMKGVYRWEQIGPQTKVYGVVAQPVMHSMSPAIHNAAFDQTGYDGVYLPLLVEAGYESFKAFMESFLHAEGLDLSGLSVTLPHKENALRYLQEKNATVEPLAASIGAVNTIVIDRDGGRPVLRGLNTDYAAILDTITDSLGIRREGLAGMRVAVLGAGGTGRTAVAALAHYGAAVTIYNRTRQRAEALAGEFDGRSGPVRAAGLDEISAASCQIYINTTSVGMHPKVGESPLGDTPPKFTAETLVFDTIYNPPATRLLQQARQAGARTVSGIEMFLRQAVGQFEHWTQCRAPAAVMRRVIEQRLGH